MTKIYYDDDIDLSQLRDKCVAIIGYGNQGSSQALNLRDSGVEVIIGNQEDENAQRARADGFTTLEISEAAKSADIIFLLLPDEIQPEVFSRDILPGLSPANTLVFAHGYSIRFRTLSPPANVDVVLLAPRMIGVAVRERFLTGAGAPAFVAVEQDATGNAWSTVLALAKGIGATRAGALATTFAEETELDLYSEQVVWPAILSLLTTSFELLTERGYQPEAVLSELYASGEPSAVFQKMADVGLFRQVDFHSRTSQYGTLTRKQNILPESFWEIVRQNLEHIGTGAFATEWAAEQKNGLHKLNRLKKEALAHGINDVEDRLRSRS